MDCRSTERDGHAAVEFSWDGEDEGDQVSGRGVAVRVGAETIEGHIFIRLGEDSRFRAVPYSRADRQSGR